METFKGEDVELIHLDHDWNSLVDIIRHRAATEPDRHAYVFLANDLKESLVLRYSELDHFVSRMASRLQQFGIRDERVALLYPHGPDFLIALFACMFVGAVAVPILPARRPGQSLERMRSVLMDASPKLALTTSDYKDALSHMAASHVPSMTVVVEEGLNSNGIDPDLPTIPPRKVSRAAICLLQYTSGSTDSPKGVMLRHANILHNQKAILQRFQHTRDSVVVSWLPVYHDMGLIGMLFQPLYVGYPCILMSPITFLQRPGRWLQAITRFRATTSGAPNFAYDLCVDRIDERDCEGLDLSSLEIAYNGAEPIRIETMKRFIAKFAPYGFRREAFFPCYGLAEATLLVTSNAKLRPFRTRRLDSEILETQHLAVPGSNDSSVREFVGCGRSPVNQSARIVDPARFRVLDDGQIGEIWVSGPCVAAGYWNRMDETAKTFNAYVTGDDNTPYLRTGDLGFLDDGELYVTGRIKDLIIIRGRNHYPQDIEATAESSHPALRRSSGAAVLIEWNGREQLAIALEVKRQYIAGLDVAEVAAAVREAVVRNHGLHVASVALLRPGKIPKTSSGKVRRRTCRSLLMNGNLPILAEDSHGGILNSK